jgi:tRNA threonylcarbamoyladenosine biosynthesis protein TsaB
MLILALDTSGDTCSVAVTEGDKLRSEYNFAHQRKLTERLPGIVDFVLRDAGTSLEEIEGFAVGLGPGSFTGVRVGVTMAKTWAQVFQKPLVGISSLEALNAAVARHHRLPMTVVAVAPSRKDEIIAAFYADICLGSPEVLATSALATRARELAPGRPILVVGEAAGFVPEEEDIGCWQEPPRASEVAALAYLPLLRGHSDDPATLTPLYIAPPPIRGGAVL